MPEICEQHTGGETFPTDTDSLQHTVTSQLMQDELAVDLSGFLVLIGDDATNEMGRCGHKCAQQVLQLLLVTVADRHKGATLSASTGHCKGIRK